VEQGYGVLTALNADEAIHLLETEADIRTVFTDIEMPGSMDGLRLAAAVRDRWPPINIILTTGKKPPENEQIPTKSLFIAKPYLPEDVLSALHSFG
jgi:two-component system, response regulator PdtaR